MKKILILLSIFLLILTVSCNQEDDRQYLSFNSNISYVSDPDEKSIATKGLAGDPVIGVCFMTYSSEKNYDRYNIVNFDKNLAENGNCFYLCFLQEPKRSNFGTSFNYILFMPKVIGAVYSNTTGDYDATAPFWWYMNTFYGITPNSHKGWSSFLNRAINDKKAPSPKASDIDQSLVATPLEFITSGYSYTWSVAELSDDTFKDKTVDRCVANLIDGRFVVSPFIEDVYFNNFGANNALIWYLTTYWKDYEVDGQKVFASEKAMSTFLSSNRKKFIEVLSNLEYDMDSNHTPKASDVPFEVELLTISEFIQKPEIKLLTKKNPVALYQTGSANVCAYETLPSKYTDKTTLYLSYSVNAFGVIDGLGLYYPKFDEKVDKNDVNDKRLTLSQLLNIVYKDNHGLTPLSGENFGWIEFFMPENIQEIIGVDITKYSTPESKT